MGTEHHQSCYYTRSPICMTAGFVFGMIVGVLIHTERSLITTLTSVLIAALVFHITFKTHTPSRTVLPFVKKGS
jgi:ABC-type uncharacterized transport system permease subunit